jgi:hypothetical protein
MRDIYIFYNMINKSYGVQSGHDENKRRDFKDEQQLIDYFKKDSETKKILERGKVRFILDAHDPIVQSTLEDIVSSLNVNKHVVQYYSGENEDKLKRYRQPTSFLTD